MQSGQYQVAGFGGMQSGLHRLLIAHLADQDHVRVLAQGVFEGGGEILGVTADFPLVDDRFAVLVEEFNGVLHGDDVHGALVVDVVDHGRQGRRLAGTGSAGD